jgi:hypothetical protein
MQRPSVGKHCRKLEAIATRKIGSAVETDGPLFQEECFDRILRDEEHLYRALQYIGRNPSKAGLRRDACPTWVRPEWEALGWRFEKEDGLPRPSHNLPRRSLNDWTG